MSGGFKIFLVALACSALVLQPAAAYSFNFGGGKWSRLPHTFWIRFMSPPTAGVCDVSCDVSCFACIMGLGRSVFTGSPGPRLPSARCLLSTKDFYADIPALLAKLAVLRAGYGSGIYNSASYYQSHGLRQQSYRSDLSKALRSSSASAAAASSGKL